MKTDDVTERMGVYKQFAQVPTGYRLEQYSAEYRHRDVWGEFVESKYDHHSEYTMQTVDRAGRDWKAHMKRYGRHHALADPHHVNEYVKYSLEHRNVKTTYNRYWQKVEAFYTWLMRHPDHHHLYHPVWMAVVEYPEDGNREVWEAKRRGI